jgi:DNA polymerase III subunit chi
MFTEVIFFTVKDNSGKVQWICQKVQEAMQNEKRLLITVPSEEAASYLDTLLWKTPEESFVPHIISRSPNSEWVVISTLSTHNLNQAQYLINLSLPPSPIYHHFEKIFELYDLTHPQKQQASDEKLAYYQSKGIKISRLIS